jgi:hypothetical protein
MAGKKIIAVVGATGAQGGGLARAILDDPTGEFTAIPQSAIAAAPTPHARAPMHPDAVPPLPARQ